MSQEEMFVSFNSITLSRFEFVIKLENVSFWLMFGTL